MGLRQGTLEIMGVNVNAEFWRGRHVLVTGHTGFKGAWLTLWLTMMGARVSGISLAPDDTPNLFELARIGEVCDSHLVDLRDAAALRAAVRALAPQIVIHCAAQPLVRLSYAEPVATWMTNVMGTIHLLEALRGLAALRAILVVTTDKCYENHETGRAFGETDSLGGADPYSGSKAATELAVASWRHSFFSDCAVGVATARAGNVIGGGDWAADRLVPDLVEGYLRGVPVSIRHPDAVRPWQHVLEPLCGYLLLAERLVNAPASAQGAWNFGPAESAITVGQIADRIAARFGSQAVWEKSGGEHLHEAHQLALDSGKARRELGWVPRLGIDTALDLTLDWYRASHEARVDMRAYTLDQIKNYHERVAA